MKIPNDAESLDPQDWEVMRALAHRAVDDAIGYLKTVRDRPVWQPIPGEVTARLDVPAPRAPEGAEAAYRDFCEIVQPHPMGNIHPRFWAWYKATRLPLTKYLGASFQLSSMARPSSPRCLPISRNIPT